MTALDTAGRSQVRNRGWWEARPMTYDWQRTMRSEPGTREWYDEIDRRFMASAYYARGADGTPFGRFLKPDDMAGRRVLEIGCGMGTHASMLARAGARLTAIDLTQRGVAMTRRRFDLFGLAGAIQQADGERLPFRDASFDAIWSWGVIHHSSSTERCLGEIARVLRPGGRALLMVYYRPCIVRYLHCAAIRGVLLGKLATRSLDEIYCAASDGAYARTFTKRELRRLLEPAFGAVHFSVVGLKAELLPIPRSRFKERIETRIPDGLASAVLGRWGSMIVVDAVRR